MITVLLATTNTAKLARLRWLLEGVPMLAQSPTDRAHLPSPTITENGADVVANAAAKACDWSMVAPATLVLASDGGLEIPALGARWSAVRTRRNAGESADDADRVLHLLHLMKDLHGEQRQTYWHEAIALARAGQLLRTWAAFGDGGLIVEHSDPGVPNLAFWTERIRYYPTVGKLYQDLTPAELEALDTVWPRLRVEVQTYMKEILTPSHPG